MTYPMPNISLIAAKTQRGVIASDGKLPWKNKSEMSYFHFRCTGGRNRINNKLIVGYRTLEGLPTSFIDRYHPKIIVYNPRSEHTGIVKFNGIYFQSIGSNISEWITQAKESIDEYLVIGGAKTYRDFFPYANRLDISTIYKGVDPYHLNGELTYFPCLDLKSYRKTTSLHCDEEDTLSFLLESYTLE